MVHQMRRRGRHSSSSTPGAPDTSPARESHNAIFSARVTMNPNEAVRRNAAFQERPEFPLDKLRDWAFAILLSCQKCFQMFGDHPVKDRFFGLTWDVFERGA